MDRHKLRGWDDQRCPVQDEKALSFEMGGSLAGLLKSLPRYATCQHVFTVNGKPVGKRGWIRDDFEQALKDAGITKFRFRDSRRTFGTQQALMGTNLKVIAELMGHKSTRMTEPYVQIARSTKKDALDKLGERLAGPQAPQTATDKVKGKTQIMS